MDGSIAATVSMRMRSQLQRACPSQSAGPEQALFEELLRVPTQSSSDKEPDAPAARDDVSSSEPVTNNSQKSTEPQERKAEDVDNNAAVDATVELNASTLYLPPVVHVESVTVSAEKSATTDSIVNRPQSAQVIQFGQCDPKVAFVASEKAQAPIASLTGAAEAVNEVKPIASTTRSPAQPVSAKTSKLPDKPQVKPQAKSEISKHSATELKSTGEPTTQPETTPVANQQQSQAPLAQRKAVEPSGNELSAVTTQQNEPTDREKLERTSQADKREKWYLGANQETQGDGSTAVSEAGDGQETDAQVANSNTEFGSRSTDHSPLDDAQSSVSDATFARDTVNSTALVDVSALAIQGASPSGSSGSVNSSGSINGSRSTTVTSSSPSISNINSTHSSSTHAATGSTVDGSAKGQDALSRNESDVRQLNQQERVRLVQRVARSFSRLGPEGGQITLKLHPPELGVLNLTVRMEGQTMSAKLRTESSAARDAILENLPVLRERLAEQGVEIESFHVDVVGGADASNDSQSQSQNLLGGEASPDSYADRANADYRRLTRNSVGNSIINPTGAAQGTDFTRWSAYAVTDRALDIRA
jgi:flagellar hook-length control protein FliK